MPGTIHNFHLQLAAATDIADDDEILIYDTSAGVPKTITPALLREETGAIVNVTATELAVTAASHAGKTVTISVTPCAITLPAASGTGNRYTFVVLTAATGTATTIAAAGTDDFEGSVAIFDTSATDITAIAFAATATDDKISMDGTTKAGTRGTRVEIIDVGSGIWSAKMTGAATGSYATPFSAT